MNQRGLHPVGRRSWGTRLRGGTGAYSCPQQVGSVQVGRLEGVGSSDVTRQTRRRPERGSRRSLSLGPRSLQGGDVSAKPVWVWGCADAGVTLVSSRLSTLRLELLCSPAAFKNYARKSPFLRLLFKLPDFPEMLLSQ